MPTSAFNDQEKGVNRRFFFDLEKLL